MRKIISIALGVLLLVGAFFVAKYLIDNKKRPKPKFDKIVKTVFVEEVNNREIPIIITTSGNLVAKHKIDLYAEVQGVLKASSKEFKAGTMYNRGESILKINSDEFYANLQSQKSNFYNSITSIMPDIRLDYPDDYQKWQTYLNNFDINKSTPELPQINSEKEKYFISGRGINTAYYNVKNLEVKLSKYNLRAPYKGVLTEALVTPGSLVRVGQKLGEFIDPSIFEMEVSINAEFADLLKVGNAVTLQNLDKTKTYIGKVIRINGKVDATSQTIKAFIQVAHEDLREGTYLEANLTARSEKDAIEVSRKLLVDNKQLYVVRDSILELIDVKPVYFSAESAVIKGVKNGTLMLSKPTPGAYNGMQVKIFEDKQ
ncbi:HlyD family efflux transporter periplasmic adaptor subunit [Flavobacteriaceae bacterium S0825]|uniref:efflux RND transporter periplasmic adaptor subunit n=1 Tax=Gaetbulibacter sp. S0825 TaxID=2720084 RepID=UPI001431B604|nr:HlyD family efflux transporter periplasmic adaptor subunit [Gaetbulibacter sp. S0825]MCK0109963.1 HlyD family efflux transporter periplasmic adaptor subunit [Flavobacteriaceae bacterium S0825]NIX65592.1 HlyD family efflux transporter periplasmic adaptor subunit [Gaetbulibacter sp. S0825]